MATVRVSSEQVLQELMTTLDVDQNKTKNTELVRRAMAKAKEYFEDIQAWEERYEENVKELEELKNDKEVLDKASKHTRMQ